MQKLEDFELFSLEEVGGGSHSLLRAPRSLPKDLSKTKGVDDVLNILMADTSGSMEDRWPEVVSGWQNYIVPKLNGRTRLYVFDSQVRFMRSDTNLLLKDYTGYATNLVTAFETIMKEVDECAEGNVRVFLITDGDHNHDFQGRQPDAVISQMKPPQGKVVCMYVLGIGVEFPVNYSIDIRSRLHNGNSNVPTLFWAKHDSEIKDLIEAISLELGTNFVTLKLNIEGCILPGLNMTSHINLGEWLYFAQPAKDVSSFTFEGYGCAPKPVTLSVEEISLRHLVDEVFPQWNSVMIQQYRVKAHVPLEMFDFMKSLFDTTMRRVESDIGESKTVKSRLASNWKRYYNVKFATLINQSKNLIMIDKKFKDEIELAESLLKTTVTSRKYDRRSLIFKGHGQKEFEEDAEEFEKLYNEAKERILALPDPTLDECCRITATSTLTDLQDPDFTLMLRESKFDFLKSFSVTGLAAYAPIKDSSQINPWTIGIRNIVGFPYCITSQIAFEFIAELFESRVDSNNKSVTLEATDNDEATRCNIIIPLVPVAAAKVIKPLVCSNLYAMMATFCIMKNPHIIDHDAHIAALTCAWIVTIRHFPLSYRPEYIHTRIKQIIATARLYLSRPAIKSYAIALLNEPDQALMTMSTKEFDGEFIKCETLVKPMFFMYLMRNNLTLDQKEKMLKLLLAEFIGRCLPNYAKRKRPTPYTDFFTKDIYDPKKEDAWIKKNFRFVLDSIKPRDKTLLETFYTLENVKATINEHISVHSLLDSSNLTADMDKIKKLKNRGKCGDITISDFKNWAQEMCLTEASIRKASSARQISVYVCEGLRTTASRERTSKATMLQREAEEIIKAKVKSETARQLKRKLLKEIRASAVGQWKEEYLNAHRDIAMPMTPEEVVRIANDRGVDVTQDTFHQVYRYDDRLLLLRNACQIPKCPHYLLPRYNFSQHLSFERRQANFPHALHLVAKTFGTEGAEAVARELTKGTLSGTNNRRRPEVPSSNSLKPLKDQLTTLLQRYNNLEENPLEEVVDDT